MDFYEVLDQIIDLLQRRGRVSYRALKRQFHLDDNDLDDLKEAILYAYAQMIVDDGRGLVWRDGAPLLQADGRHGTEAERRFYALLPGVMALLRQEQRVTYRTLKYVFGLDETFLEDVRRELGFKRLALDEDGAGLVWTGEGQPAVPSVAAPPRPPAPPPEAVAVTSPASLESSLPITKTEPLHDGAAAPPAPVHHAPDAERRQLTVLFCDLVGSTQLSGQLDPEDLRTVVRAYQEVAAEVIQHYEGHIAQYLGDGLLVYFGYPVAHEDDARRAVHTGLGIVQAITTLNTRLAAQYGVQLAVRLGIHTGPVVVGQMGGGERHEHLALGETPNLSARLQSLAPANAVVISAVTARLVRGTFTQEDLGTHALHGVAEPMTVSRVRGLLATPSHDEEFVAAGAPLLVGREEESGLLRRRWELVPVLLGLWRYYNTRPQLHTARELGETLLRLAQQAHDPALAVVAHYALGSTWFWLGALPAARRHLEEGIALYTPDQRQAPAFRMGQDPGVACRGHAALTLWVLGYPDQALARLHTALALAHELSHPYSLAWARCWAAIVSQLRRDVPAVHEHAEAAIALSTEQGFALWAASGTSLRGWALALQGQGAEGMAQVRQGIAAGRATGAMLRVPYFSALLADVAAQLGHREDGLQALAEAHTLMEQHEERWWEAEISRLRGVLLLRQPGTPQEEAETCFQRALDVARRQEAKSLELRVAMSLARLWQQSKQVEARQLLTPVYGWFTEGFDTADLQEAKALLEELA